MIIHDKHNNPRAYPFKARALGRPTELEISRREGLVVLGVSSPAGIVSGTFCPETPLPHPSKSRKLLSSSQVVQSPC